MSTLISYAKEPMSREMLAAQAADAADALGTAYALTLTNQSNQNWIFYVYQKMPAQVADVFSLAWFCSPYEIKVGDRITFQWEIEYNFTWSDTGVLMPGVTYSASGEKDCSPAGKNTTEFALDPGPGLSDPVKSPPAGSLVINDGSSVPANQFSVGIGMSGTGSYAVQAGPNLTHTFTPTPSYYVAAGKNLTVGTVLSIDTITKTAEAKFKNAVYHLDCTLNDANEWEIAPA